jgi:hypothetical protein
LRIHAPCRQHFLLLPTESQGYPKSLEWQPNKLPLPQPLSSLSPSSSSSSSSFSAKNKQTTVKGTMRLEDYGKALLAAYRVMEPATVIVSLARNMGHGKLSTDVQSFILEKCIEDKVNIQNHKSAATNCC